MELAKAMDEVAERERRYKYQMELIAPLSLIRGGGK